MSYIGNEPIVSATRTVTEVSATAGQTVFTANGGYTVGFIDVFVNGSKLTNSDFTATNGTTITLNEAAQASDIVRLEALGTFLTSSALTANNPNYTGTLTGGTGVVNIGSGQVYKDTSGNVGFGTSSPNQRLHIGGVGSALAFDTTGGNGANTIKTTADFSLTMSCGRGVGSAITLSNAAAEGIRFIVEGADRARIESSGQQQSVIPGGTTLYPQFACRAWVNFNGSGTVAIRASGNVSSITDLGTGYYRVNFSTAMPDANYAVAQGPSNIGAGVGNLQLQGWGAGFFEVQTRYQDGSLYDWGIVHLAFFR